MEWLSRERERRALFGKRVRANAIRRTAVALLAGALLLGAAGPCFAVGSVGSSSAGNDYQHPPASGRGR